MKIHNVNGFLILCRFLSFTHKRKFGEVRSCVLERATPGSSYTHRHTHRQHTQLHIHILTYKATQTHRYIHDHIHAHSLTDTLRYTNGDTHTGTQLLMYQ